MRHAWRIPPVSNTQTHLILQLDRVSTRGESALVHGIKPRPLHCNPLQSPPNLRTPHAKTRSSCRSRTHTHVHTHTHTHIHKHAQLACLQLLRTAWRALGHKHLHVCRQLTNICPTLDRSNSQVRCLSVGAERNQGGNTMGNPPPTHTHTNKRTARSTNQLEDELLNAFLLLR